jgi:hypothetical protein
MSKRFDTQVSFDSNSVVPTTFEVRSVFPGGGVPLSQVETSA